jgi:hypothetical protein
MSEMDAFWDSLKGLEGGQVKTLRGRAFNVLSVQRSPGLAVTLAPVSTGKMRRIAGDSLEGAYRIWKRNGEVTPSEVTAAGLSFRNASYVAALVNAAGKKGR